MKENDKGPKKMVKAANIDLDLTKAKRGEITAKLPFD